MLGVFAHPDDECYGPGGTIAHYALGGAEVAILMFTCGEAGSIGVSRELEPEELCRRRRVEFARSCDALGVARHRIVGAPDKGVARMGERDAVGHIKRELDAFRPQVVVTFHNRGVSGHPDHIAVARFLATAFDEAANGGPVRLFEWGIPEANARLYDRPNLVPTPEDEVDTRLMPSEEALDRKIEAIRRHETQYDFFLSMQERFDYRSVSVPECFTLRRSRVQGDVSEDLLAGIDAP